MWPAVAQPLLAAPDTQEKLWVAAVLSAASAFPYETTVFKAATNKPRKKRHKLPQTKGSCPPNYFSLKKNLLTMLQILVSDRKH